MNRFRQYDNTWFSRWLGISSHAATKRTPFASLESYAPSHDRTLSCSGSRTRGTSEVSAVWTMTVTVTAEPQPDVQPSAQSGSQESSICLGGLLSIDPVADVKVQGDVKILMLTIESCMTLDGA